MKLQQAAYTLGVEGRSTISSDILARYAGDAALDVSGVGALVPSPLHRHKGVRIDDSNGEVRIEIHISVEWNAPIFDVGETVQRRVREYLQRMAHMPVGAVDVVVDEVGQP